MREDNRLGEYLKARRARVTPEAVGLPGTARRRVSGLRRAELAALAGVSEQYLVRLEQGRDRHPSPQVLGALARALRLDDDGAAHLRRLADPQPAPGTPEVPADGLQELLDAWDVPAYARGRHFDVLASNELARRLVPAHAPGRNLVRDVFLDPRAREWYVDWPAVAAHTVGALRAAALDEPSLRELVEALVRESPTFRELWARHDVRPTRDETKLFRHPVAGVFALRRHVLQVAGTHGQVIIAYRAGDGPAADALERIRRTGDQSAIDW
ncbi:transcriptional regulator [Virgisporangium aliadipatigenens]|uniref:Transcriptional regulator n=1 Tax=Virgisporangium aliadipatigenens TaxID=741659 RepID=A0A8J3YLT7_9ACTN|nr:helix-turn-helix transcriptional regulator [Virgisporangium aliadipatigenens]GIJ46245.1 transcriptional regulator [Virgisporangium aliadipatigenens]